MALRAVVHRPRVGAMAGLAGELAWCEAWQLGLPFAVLAARPAASPWHPPQAAEGTAAFGGLSLWHPAHSIPVYCRRLLGRRMLAGDPTVDQEACPSPTAAAKAPRYVAWEPGHPLRRVLPAFPCIQRALAPHSDNLRVHRSSLTDESGRPPRIGRPTTLRDGLSCFRTILRFGLDSHEGVRYFVNRF